MKILKHGKRTEKKDEQIKTFTCQCGCEFSAKKDEYHDGTYDHSLSVITACITHYYYANCPECHKMCCRSEQDTNRCETYIIGSNKTWKDSEYERIETHMD